MNIVCDQRYISFFCLFLFVAVASFGAFIGGLWAILGIGGAIILFAATTIKMHQIPRPSRDTVIFAAIIFVVMALDNTQSIASAVSWQLWFRLLSIVVPLLLLSSPDVQRYSHHPSFVAYVLMAAIFGATALGVELSLGGPLLKYWKGPRAELTQYNRGLSYLVILAFPLLAGICVAPKPFMVNKRNIMLAVLFILALLFPAGLTESRAAKLALLAGLVTTCAAYFLPMATLRILTILPFSLLAWPFAAQQFFATYYDRLKHFPDSWHARIEIWDYMSYRILERPWLGWGLGTSHLLPFQQPDGAQYVFTLMPAAHPHNVVIELWVELGIPGIILGIAFALLMLKKARALSSDIRPFALGAWMAALCLSLVAYDFWTDSLFAAFALTGFGFVVMRQKVHEN